MGLSDCNEGTPLLLSPLAYEGTPLAYEGTPSLHSPLAYEGTPLAYEGTPLAYEGTPLLHSPLIYGGTPLRSLAKVIIIRERDYGNIVLNRIYKSYIIIFLKIINYIVILVLG